MKLDNDTALRSRVDIDGAVLSDEMLTGHGETSGDLLVNEGLVLCHFGGMCYVLCGVRRVLDEIEVYQMRGKGGI